MTTPYANVEKLSSPYTVGELYWSIRKNGETIAANFWYMLNDGYYDMEDEFFDCWGEPKMNPSDCGNFTHKGYGRIYVLNVEIRGAAKPLTIC